MRCERWGLSEQDGRREPGSQQQQQEPEPRGQGYCNVNLSWGARRGTVEVISTYSVSAAEPLMALLLLQAMAHSQK